MRGTPRTALFDEITPDSEIRRRLASVYPTVEHVDLWIGSLSQPPPAGSHLGELATLVIHRQFEALRDGERFWYERALAPEDRERVRATRLVGREAGLPRIFRPPDTNSPGPTSPQGEQKGDER
jgi:peroxidase